MEGRSNLLSGKVFVVRLMFLIVQDSKKEIQHSSREVFLLAVTVANGSVERGTYYKYGSCNGANFQHLIYDEQTMQIKNSKKDSDGRTMCMQGSTYYSYPIESMPCNASNRHQKWTFHSNGQLIQVANGRCGKLRLVLFLL